jgi:hypothetical protein
MTRPYNRNPIACVSLAALIFVSFGCSRRPSASSTEVSASDSVHGYRTPADRPPASLLSVGDAAVDVFDAAWQSDWRRAGLGLLSVNEAATEIPDPSKPDLVEQLHDNIAAVTDGIEARQQATTMTAANAITQVVAEMSAEYERAVPYDVKMLGYYGRQIELGIAAGRPAVAVKAASDLATVWHRIEPAIVRRGYADEAGRFTDLVAELTGAAQPGDLVAPVSAELAAVPRIERLFTSPK